MSSGQLATTSATVSRADALRFQRYLHARQYPSDCGSTVGMRARQDYFHVLGLGAQMVSLKFNFLHALLQSPRAVYHFPTSHYVNPLRCPSRSFECYFASPSNCSWASGGRAPHRRVENVKIHWCFDLPRRRLSRLAGLRAVHAKEWYHAQLAAFLFRPNSELAAFGRELMGNMEGTIAPPPGAAALNPAAAGSASHRVGGNGSCVAMHIRRTDKHTEDHRTAQRSFADFAQTFKAWGYWKYDGAVTSLRAFLGSEDPKTFTAMPPLLAPHAAYWIPPSYFVMDGSSGRKFHDIKQGNSRLGELYGGLEDEAKRVGVRSAAQLGKDLHKDEGMVLVAQIVLMSGCEAVLASYSSNVAVLVHDLMLARKVARGEEMHALDVNGRVYCGCGASFCMNLERKTVREGGRSIKHVVDGFHY
jgi:hypothetical protein